MATDSPAAACFVEVLGRIGVGHCFVARTAVSPVHVHRDALVFGARVLPLPCSAKPDAVVVHPSEPDHLHLRVLLARALSDGEDAGATDDSNLALLQDLRAAAAPVACGACRAVLTPRPFRVVLPLPQPGWEDLTGYLSCHGGWAGPRRVVVKGALLKFRWAGRQTSSPSSRRCR